MYGDTEKYLATCRACMAHKTKQQAEPLERDIPSTPWLVITLDNFVFRGTQYLIIFDCFSRFIAIKTPSNLSARSTIHSLLEVFCEHGVPSSIHSDRGCNFVSNDFVSFCKDLGIELSYSGGYHHSANQAERPVHTVKDLMKCCYSASVHWRLALLEYLCTPGPCGKSPPQLLYRQFRGIMPCFNDSSDCISDSKKLIRKREEVKEKFDVRHSCELKPLVIGSTVSFLNADLKTWGIGKINGCSMDNRSYQILTEHGTVISRNHLHLRETGVEFSKCILLSKSIVDPMLDAHGRQVQVQDKMASSSPVTSQPPKSATTSCSNSSKKAIQTNADGYRTRSGRIIRKPPRFCE